MLLLGNLRRYIAGTSKRFATRRGGEGLKQRSLRIALVVTLISGCEPLAPSPLRGEGWGIATFMVVRGRVLAKSSLRSPESQPHKYRNQPSAIRVAIPTSTLHHTPPRSLRAILNRNAHCGEFFANGV